MFGWLVSRVYEALFVAGDVGFRRAHIVVKILFTLSTVYAVSRGLEYSIIPLVLIIASMAFTEQRYSVKPALIVSSIPAIWLALTGALIRYLIGEGVGPMSIFEVYVKTLTMSLVLVFFVASMSPYELSMILWRLGSRKYSIIPVALWRLTPVVLRDIIEAYNVQKLKGEKLWKALAVSTASALEHRDFLLEYNYHKLGVELVEPAPHSYDSRATLLLLLETIIVLVPATII